MNAKIEIFKITRAQKDMKKTHTKEADKLREDRVEESFACMTTALESKKTFAPERDEAMSQATLETTERASKNARYHEVIASLRRISKARDDKKNNPAATIVKSF